MAINSLRGLETGTLFTTNGKDVWVLGSYFDCPSLTLINLETKEKETFGAGSLNAQSYKKLIPEDTVN